MENPQGRAIKKDSDMYKALDTLAKQVKIVGIFSDWPATVTYYANCMRLEWSFLPSMGARVGLTSARPWLIS